MDSPWRFSLHRVNKHASGHGTDEGTTVEPNGTCGWSGSKVIRPQGLVLGELADSREAHLAYFFARRRYFLISEKRSQPRRACSAPYRTLLLWDFDWRTSDSEYT